MLGLLALPAAGVAGMDAVALAMAMRPRSMAGSVTRRVGVEALDALTVLGVEAQDHDSAEGTGAAVRMAGSGWASRTTGTASPLA